MVSCCGSRRVLLRAGCKPKRGKYAWQPYRSQGFQGEASYVVPFVFFNMTEIQRSWGQEALSTCEVVEDLGNRSLPDTPHITTQSHCLRASASAEDLTRVAHGKFSDKSDWLTNVAKQDQNFIVSPCPESILYDSISCNILGFFLCVCVLFFFSKASCALCL